jgi:DNA-binding NarL/FixJ family response regulator
MPPASPVRVVVADDHPTFRFGLIVVLDRADEVEVVGEAADGAELVAVAERTEPDVVVTDLAMPDMTGTEATRTLLARNPDLAVLVLTMHDEDEALFGAMRAGARGYLLKGAGHDQIIRAVLDVADGHAVYGAAIARRIQAVFTETPRVYAAQIFPNLTEREREVLDLLATGSDNHAIARRLSLSEKTVRNHVSTIFTKLQVRDRAAAVAKARDAGLGSP